MKQLFSNRYVEAFIKTMAIYGMVHVVIITILAFRGNMEMLNFFNVLDLQEFVPGLDKGIQSFIISHCISFGIYCFVFLHWTKNRKKK